MCVQFMPKRRQKHAPARAARRVTAASVAATAVAVAWAAGPVAATRAGDWTHLAGDAAHTGRAARAPTDLGNVLWTATPAEIAGGLEEFVWHAGVVAATDRVVITARRFEDDGTGVLVHTHNLAIGYDARSGQRLWDAPIDADAGGNDSGSTAAIDTAGHTAIVVSDHTVYALDLEVGHVVWQCELPQQIVNASPTVTTDLAVAGVPANRVFITDYTGFSSGGGIYAINTSPYDAAENPYLPGEIVWQDRTLPGSSGNTAAYADGRVYVASTFGGEIRCYPALDGGAPGSAATPCWTTVTGAGGLSALSGLFGGVAVRGEYVYAAAYTFYGSGNSSRLYKLRASDGTLVWSQPCERTRSIPVVADDGRIYLSAGIDGFGSAVKIQAFVDHGPSASLLWDTWAATGGALRAGGWAHQPFIAGDRLYCGAPQPQAMFDPYAELLILDLSRTPGEPEFLFTRAAGSGGGPAPCGRFLYSLGTDGLTAYAMCGDGDLDVDGDVDFADLAALWACLNGPGRPAPDDCPAARFACADADHDGDVDLADFAGAQTEFAGD